MAKVLGPSPPYLGNRHPNEHKIYWVSISTLVNLYSAIPCNVIIACLKISFVLNFHVLTIQKLNKFGSVEKNHRSVRKSAVFSINSLVFLAPLTYLERTFHLPHRPNVPYTTYLTTYLSSIEREKEREREREREPLG